MSSVELPNGEYTIRTLDGRVLAYPFMVKPDLGDIIIPPHPKPVYALPSTLQPERFSVSLVDPERGLYQISALVNDGGRLVGWVVPETWVLIFVAALDAYLVRIEFSMSAWVAPNAGKYGQCIRSMLFLFRRMDRRNPLTQRNSCSDSHASDG